MRGKDDIIVQKFGGTSVANFERMRRAAEHVKRAYSKGLGVAVVVSAMAGETDKLINLGRSAVKSTYDDEMDVLVSTGEQVSCAIFSMILREMGIKSKSYLGHQIRIITDSNYTNARIIKIETEKLLSDIQQKIVPVIAGFQGVTPDGRITTLGRGGSDTTAVAIAAALKAKVCEIYTDVPGVFTTDPNLVSSARKINFISYEEMVELASLGAKVLQIRSVEIAARFNLPIHVRSTFSDETGTIVASDINKISETPI
ncbi:MAG: aspartate kinase [Candidatus Calescibacterium sp.]|nr:aspartate kinase [Candidatus Calescibacterium sp.]MCX7734040.1 aspartate kinase [bacterium]MDW8086360.1 aspartate kinase [Candidatus Calescibacterium sp.]